MTSKIFDIFVGKLVFVITKSIKGSQKRGNTTHVGPSIIDGYLLDEDDTYFFLGSTPEEVTDAIQKDEVVRMYEPGDEVMEMMPESEMHS